MSAWEDLAVEVHDGSGPHVLLVHGFLSSRSHWLPNLEALGEVCTPVVIEQYGHGRAATVDDPSLLSPHGYVEAFEQIRTALGIDRWFLVGHSLGGAITVRYAIERPERVIGHVFTNSQSAFADATWLADAVERSAVLAARLQGPQGREVLDRHPMHPRNAGRIPAEVGAALVSDFEGHDPVGIANQMLHTLPGASVRSIIHSNTRPALMTIGAGETDFADAAAHVSASMPRLETVELDAGHNVNLHQSGAWNEAVAAFIRRHDKGT